MTDEALQDPLDADDSVSLPDNNNLKIMRVHRTNTKCLFKQTVGVLLYLGTLPLDAGLHLQLPQREVIVHEQSVPAHCRADVRGLRCHVPCQQVGQPAAGLSAEQLVGTHRVHIVV